MIVCGASILGVYHAMSTTVGKIVITGHGRIGNAYRDYRM